MKCELIFLFRKCEI